jgi:hypothetical protein
MNRNEVIRAQFDAYSDLVWVEDLLPKLQRYGIEGEQLNNYREAWYRRTFARDWEWWQEESKKSSTQELRDDLADIARKLDALGVEQWWKRKGTHDVNKVQEILDSVTNGKAPEQEQTRTQERGRKR